MQNQPFPAWIVECPHRGEPEVYGVENLHALEQSAQSELDRDGRTLYHATTYECVAECFGNHVDGVDWTLKYGQSESAVWNRLIHEKRGVVIETPGGFAWHDAEPERSESDRIHSALAVLREHWNHVKFIPTHDVARVLDDPTEWYDDCGGQEARVALRQEAGPSAAVTISRIAENCDVPADPFWWRNCDHLAVFGKFCEERGVGKDCLDTIGEYAEALPLDNYARGNVEELLYADRNALAA